MLTHDEWRYAVTHRSHPAGILRREHGVRAADDAAALELGIASGLGGLQPVVEQKLAAGHD